MLVVPIQQKSNQAFTCILNGLVYRVALRTIQGFTYMSAWVNGEPLFYNQVCTPNNWVNHYNYISVNGKFYFKCMDKQYPNYKNFNATQQLLFLTPDEVAQVKGQIA